jgi:hypothetical protein
MGTSDDESKDLFEKNLVQREKDGNLMEFLLLKLKNGQQQKDSTSIYQDDLFYLISLSCLKVSSLQMVCIPNESSFSQFNCNQYATNKKKKTLLSCKSSKRNEGII